MKKTINNKVFSQYIKKVLDKQNFALIIHNTTQHNTTQHNTTQHNTTQRN